MLILDVLLTPEQANARPRRGRSRLNGPARSEMKL
jgi:hypothetical protein